MVLFQICYSRVDWHEKLGSSQWLLRRCPGYEERKAPVFLSNVVAWNEHDLCGQSPGLR